MIFHIITIFPNIFDSYCNESILKRAQEKKIIKIKMHNLRDYTTDAHRTVDDSPYGGGPGMVFKIEPLYRAINAIRSEFKIKKLKFMNRTILFSTRGKKFDEKAAQRLAHYKNLILICGRYEGVDERVAQHIADEEISIGDFTLSGGELPAMMLIEAISRFVPGVLGKKESLETIRGSYPTYTRPEVFFPKIKNPRTRPRTAGTVRGRQKSKIKNGWKVPKVLLSGNHDKINEWRKK